MKLVWLLSENLTSKLNIEELSDVAPTWGGCKVWDNYKVDNIVCTDIKKSKKLVERDVQRNANLFIPSNDVIKLNNPPNVKAFQGEFKDPNINFKDDIVGINIAANMYDIVLLLGFKFNKSKSKDKLTIHKQQAYLHNIKTIISENPDKQFVLVNYKGALSKEFSEIENLTRDSLSNVLELAKEL